VSECFEDGLELIEAVVDALTTPSLHQRLAHLTQTRARTHTHTPHRTHYHAVLLLLLLLLLTACPVRITRIAYNA